jgi:aspartokinase/homoserine dehydrogenase 1
LRYIGELSGDLQNDKGFGSQISVPSDTALGGLKGSDSFFEIYTESYGDRPIVIQGAELDQQLRLEVFWRYLEII